MFFRFFNVFQNPKHISRAYILLFKVSAPRKQWNVESCVWWKSSSSYPPRDVCFSQAHATASEMFFWSCPEIQRGVEIKIMMPCLESYGASFVVRFSRNGTDLGLLVSSRIVKNGAFFDTWAWAVFHQKTSVQTDLQTIYSSVHIYAETLVAFLTNTSPIKYSHIICCTYVSFNLPGHGRDHHRSRLK